MNIPTWKLIKNPQTGLCDIVWREWENGMQESMPVTNEKYIRWLSEGNEPLPADE
jgi:hypothetical protein